jgi:uncharacterized cupin superfamily protein
MTVALLLHRADGAPLSSSSPDGSVLSANAGDAVFVAQGAPIGWESSEHVAKFYVVQNVPA